MRGITIALALVAALAARAEAEDDLARLFPADTFAYLEVDATAAEQGLPETQVMKILADPRLKTLLAPGFERLGLDADKPVDSILAKLRLSDVLTGSAAVGVRGISFVVRDATGNETSFRIAPGTPVNARDVYRFVALTMRTSGPGGKMTFDIDVDFLAVGRPGVLGRQLVGQALDLLEGKVTRTAQTIGEDDVTHVRVEVPFFGGLTYGFNFYVAERDGLSLIATHKDVLASALAGGPPTSLAASPSLAQARARLTNGRRLLLLHVDLALALDAVKTLLPPAVVEMGDINGLNALRGVGFGVSLAEGGVRESFGILLDGNPRGVWRLLDAMPTGLRSLEVAPPGALAAVGVKLDSTVLRERWRSFVADVSPGNEGAMEDELSSEFLRETGLSLFDEVLPALGDEAAIFLFPPHMGELFPQAVVGVDARDEAAMSKLVAKLQEQAGNKDVRFTAVELPGGIAATRVTAQVPYEIHFAVHNRHLFIATNATLLADVFAKWGTAGGKSMRRDDAILPRVLAGAGVDPDRVAALGYVNLRAAGIETIKCLPILLGGGRDIPKEWVDMRGFSELIRIPNHLTGVAVTLSHDKDAFVLDCFSPAGLLVPVVGAAIAEEMWRRERVAQRMVAVAPQAPGKASLGIAACTTDGAGVTVLALTGADDGGLRKHDRIVAFDGVAIQWVEDLKRELEKRKPGETVKLTVKRDGEEAVLEVELGVAEGSGW